MIRGTRPVKLTEVPAQPSRLVAPSGLIATRAERAAMAAAGAGGGGGRFVRGAEREEERTEVGSR